MSIKPLKFTAKSQYHLESDCGRYLISRSKVGVELVYTLTHGGVFVANHRCKDVVADRLEAVNLLKEMAGDL